MRVRVRAFLGFALLTAAVSAQAYESAAPELGVAASKTEHFAQAFRLPLGALYRWVAANPEAVALPTFADLTPLMFEPPATAGYELTLTAPGAGLLRLCVKAQLNARFEASGFASAANRVGAELGNAACVPDNGASVLANGFPRVVSMAKTIDTRKVLSVATLPAQPQVTLPAAGVVDLANGTPSVTLTVTNNTEATLQLMAATSSDASFAIGSTCQTPVAPAATCSIEVALAQAVTVKHIGRVQLTFSTGDKAAFSVRGQP